MKLTELNEMFEKMNFGKNQVKNGKFAKFKSLWLPQYGSDMDET